MARRVDNGYIEEKPNILPGYYTFYYLHPFTYYIVKVAGETADGFSAYFKTEVIARTSEGGKLGNKWSE